MSSMNCCACHLSPSFLFLAVAAERLMMRWKHETMDLVFFYAANTLSTRMLNQTLPRTPAKTCCSWNTTLGFLFTSRSGRCAEISCLWPLTDPAFPSRAPAPKSPGEPPLTPRVSVPRQPELADAFIGKWSYLTDVCFYSRESQSSHRRTVVIHQHNNTPSDGSTTSAIVLRSQGWCFTSFHFLRLERESEPKPK